MSAGAGPRLECRMPERVITLAISDADWKALRAVQPEPVDWLKRTIRDAIDRSAPLSRADAGPERPRREGRRRPRASADRARRGPQACHKAGLRRGRARIMTA